MKADQPPFDTTSPLKDRRIIFVLGSLELGGAERQALTLAGYLSAREGARVEVWGFNLSGPAGAICDRHGLAWRVIPFYFTGGLPGRLTGLKRLARIIRDARPDILLPYTLIPNVVCGLTWRLTGARACVWNQRDAGIERAGYVWERCAVRLTPQFISNSRQGARFIIDELKAPASKVQVIHNGVEHTSPGLDRASWRERLRVDECCFVACMVGNLHRHKDHETLLKAWRVVVTTLEAEGHKAVLILAGSLYDTYESLASLSRSLGINERVIFAGHVTDVAGLLGAADIAVFSSRSEGCPNAVLESMGAGLAVAGTDVEGVREVLGAAGAPHLAPVGDAEALAQTILNLARDPALCAALGEENRRRVRDGYDAKRMCEETASLLGKLLPR
jgi:glycosyltransferase involved in cell wall biosynthesis